MFIPQLLVTDDDAAFRQAVCEGLGRRGFRVCQARDGIEAIQLIGQTDVHVALIDVHMPRMDGLSVIRELSSLPNRPAVVLMSARMDSETRQQAISMAAYEVLDKPVPLRRLTSTICNALAEIYGWQAPAAG
jgi:two-component system chemotaxis response regulator CheY